MISSPLRITFATCELNFCKASKDFSALLSCATPIIAFIITTISIIIESVMPSFSIYPIIPDTNAAIIKIIIMKSLNCSKNFISSVFFFLAFNSLIPYFFLLSSTPSKFNPFFKSVLKYSDVSVTVLLNQFFSILFSPFLNIIINLKNLTYIIKKLLKKFYKISLKVLLT